MHDMEDVLRVLVMIGGLAGIAVSAFWGVAGALQRARRGRPADRRELALLGERMSRLEQAVDSVAVEVERVGEGQRFVTKLMAGDRAPADAGRAAQSAR